MLDSWCTQTTNTHTRQPPDPTWSSFHYACTCLQTSLKHIKPMTNRGCSLSTSTLGTLSEASRRDHINIQEYAKTVTSNTAQCTEDVTVGKNFTTCGNQKTWKTTEVCSLLTHHCSQHSVLTHLDSKDNHARLLYIDFIYFFSFGRGIRKELNGEPRYSSHMSYLLSSTGRGLWQRILFWNITSPLFFSPRCLCVHICEVVLVIFIIPTALKCTPMRPRNQT